MRSAAEHLAQVLALVGPPVPRRVALADALDAVLAVDVRAAGDLPPFDNSAMDGYAVRAADVAEASEGAPVRLALVGESAAGHPWDGVLGAGETVRIMTGAPVPAGADAVVPQELVAAAAGAVLVDAPTPLGRHIRRRAEDARAGDLVVPAGVRLRPRHLAAAAAAGSGELVVMPAPRVAYLATGDELVRPGTPLAPGRIWESNATYLEAALRSLGAVPVDLGTVGDRGEDVRAAVEAADADLVVTTGGASVGDHDPVKEGLAGAGVEFLRVAIQPGKPQGLGVVAGTPVVCLPGNPVAVAVCVELFVGPAVRAMRGIPEPEWEPMRALEPWRCPPGREQVMPVVIEGAASGEDGRQGVGGSSGSAGVRPATSGGSGSHLAARLAAADGLARVRAEADTVEAGDIVAVRRFTV
ncbi:molybdopterin molybdotransferase MoeA [Demequina sp. SYSU T00192]|uniref:Molybdopterin molybdenumtransferase n=1 Tax=Demequina litoralis TaxID=3051660 RepID=A0ABT8GBL8_9MICO|nr:gephyrin-like molybdotransferase Glp [Demequina sp. SYSU T00192]MDN4476537.1 molybdopterin molybdotransferase MoeA [Demequina sp. SYSU T00192]